MPPIRRIKIGDVGVLLLLASQLFLSVFFYLGELQLMWVAVFLRVAVVVDVFVFMVSMSEHVKFRRSSRSFWTIDLVLSLLSLANLILTPFTFL